MIRRQKESSGKGLPPAGSILTQKARKISTAMAVGVLTLLSAIVSVALLYSVTLYRQAEALLKTVHAIKVGEALNVRTLANKQPRAIAYVKTPPSASYFYDDPSRLSDREYANQFVIGSLDQCANVDCTVSIPGPRLQSDYLYALSARHPTILLPVFRWIFSRSTLHRWLPIAWLDPVKLVMKNGVVQELDIQMRSLSVDDQVCPQAEIRITAGSPETASWEVLSTLAHMTGNSDCGSVHGIRVNATTDATQEQLADALDFNPRCLLPGGDCTECEMLPMICKHYAHSIRKER